MLFRPRDLT
jgi:hypothetical protein